jgi:Flp pilus assembly protein TadD
VYLKSKLYKDTAKSFEQAVQLSPEHPTLRYHLGLAYLEMGEKEKAREALKTSLALSTNFPESEDARKLLNKL